MKPVLVVMVSVLFNQLSCLLKREWGAWSHTFPFQCLVPALEFAVTLRIIYRCANMCHPWYPNEFFEILSHKLRSIVRYYSRSCLRIFLLCPLQNHFNICLSNRFTNLMMNYITAASIGNTAKIIESTLDIQIGNINMPMLMRSRWLLKSFSFFVLLFGQMHD